VTADPKNLWTRCTSANLFWKKVFMMHRALLQHCCHRSHPLSLTLTSASPCLPVTLLHHSQHVQ